MRSKFIFVYVLLVAFHLIAISLDNLFLNHLSKPLLLISLIVFVVWQKNEFQKTIFTLLLFGLFFSWIGDVLLMYQDKNELYFMGGLGAFLLAHIGYIFALRKARNSSETTLVGPKRVKYIAYFWFIFGGLIYLLSPVLGALLIPVLLYAIAITTMGVSALIRAGRTSAKSYNWALIGAILFIISDGVLAFNKFLEPISYSGIWIMTTYAFAQLGIVIGLKNHA